MPTILKLKLTRSMLLRYDVLLVGVSVALLFLYPKLWENIFNTGYGDDMFMSHGVCYYWVPQLWIMHLTADFLIGASYVAISLTLALIVYKARRDVPFSWMFIAFGLFIAACGATHFMEVWTLWHATYWLSGYVKLVTAVASVTTAVMLPTIVAPALGLVQASKDAVEYRLSLEKANEELKKEIAERQKVEKELQKSTIELQRSNRELEDFAAIASHDLQEPLRKIQTFGEDLMESANSHINEEERDYIERMQKSATRMRALISDLLTFSRVTTTAQPFKKTDLNRIAAEVVSDLEPRISETGASVVVGELPAIEADPTQMQQVLQNLITNALKFQKPGTTPEVSISSENLSDNRCRITVRDNGIGFDEKYLDRIFTMFQRLHGRSEYEGTGVGLAVVRKIIERHGGSITVESAPDAGATFFITLPIMQIETEIS